MIKIELDATTVAAIYNGSNKDARQAFKDALGEQFSKVLPIESRIKTFDDAYNELGEEHPLCKEYRTVKYGYLSNVGKDLLAYLQLRIITAALNEGWEPKFVKGEQRWYGWYNLIDKDEYESLSEEEKSRSVLRSYNYSRAGGGLAFAGAYYASSHSSTSLGSRLSFKNAELAEYAGKQFAEIYADFCFIPSTEND